MQTREISKLKANPQNPRGAVVRDEAFRDLVASIKSQGVLQSILITPNDLIVAGHRRVEAAEEAGLEVVPVVVREMTKIEQLQAMLAENLLRADLNVLQEGAAYQLLVDYGLKQSEISKAVGVKSSRIAECLAVQSLPAEIQGYFLRDSICLNCAPVLAALTTAAEQEQWANTAIDHKMNGVALRGLIHGKPRVPQKPKDTVKSGPYFLREMIRQLEEIDERLEDFEGLRSAQLLIRQAVSQLIGNSTAKAAASRAAQPAGRVVDSSQSFASIASFAQRGAQVKR